MPSVLFECHHVYYLPNFTPIIQEMGQREGYTIYASIPMSMPKQERDIFTRVCSELNISILRAENESSRILLIKEKQFDIIIVGNIGKLHEIVHKNSVTVMVYHGIGMKQTYYRDISDRIDLRAVESEDRYNRLQNDGYSNLALVGYTKTDPLFSPEKSKEEILDNLGLDATKKTILYAPTFYPSSIEKITPEFEKFSGEYNLIVKLHNFSWFQKKYHFQSEFMKKSLQRLEHNYLASPAEIDIIPLMIASDLLISDVSSTLFEYLPLNKPIIMAKCFSLRFKHRILKYRFNRKLDYDRLASVDFVYPLENSKQLKDMIIYALNHSNEMSPQRKKAANNYLYKTDGKASLRLVDAIEKAMERN